MRKSEEPLVSKYGLQIIEENPNGPICEHVVRDESEGASTKATTRRVRNLTRLKINMLANSLPNPRLSGSSAWVLPEITDSR